MSLRASAVVLVLRHASAHLSITIGRAPKSLRVILENLYVLVNLTAPSLSLRLEMWRAQGHAEL